MTVEIRAITEDELPAFNATESMTFGELPSAEGLAESRRVYEPGRAQAAFVDGELVGTTNAYSFAMTMPGGVDPGVRVAGVSDVTVAPTHRRRGLLRSLMQAQLDDVLARGEPMAVLNASEAAIYRRFGYGLAQSYQSWSIDTHRTAFREPVGDDIRLRRMDRGAARPILPAIYDGWRRQQPGAMTHSNVWWDLVLGPRDVWKGGGALHVVVAEPGEVAGRAHDGGYAIYLIDHTAPSGDQVVHARNIVAVDDLVRARLWRYLMEIDLAGTVVCEDVALDDPLRWWLTDTRRVRTTKVRDYLFVRILDVPAVLTARRYDHDGTIVLDVVDGFRPAAATTSGRWRLTQRDGEVTCEPTTDPADLRLDVAELGTLSLGGFTARELARTQLIDGRPDAVRTADELFGWPVAPHCITRF